MATIYYHDIGDYLSREQKLKMVHDFRSVKGMEWTEIVPNEKGDWINQRDNSFDTLLPLFPLKKFGKGENCFFMTYSLGIASSRDTWVWNFNRKSINHNMHKTIAYYKEMQEKLSLKLLKEVEYAETEISWNDSLITACEQGTLITYKDNVYKTGYYRPYCKQYIYFDKIWIQRTYQQTKLFINGDSQNLIVCVPCVGSNKDFMPIITNMIPDLGMNSGCQCFPLYWYEENTHKQKTLFDDTPDDDYIRHDGITDWILKEVRNRYHGAKNITKEMIFYYVYGLLHSKDYRERFAADLKKSLPRIPIVERIEDFMAFYKAGMQLAELHLNYEEVPPHPEVVVHITAKRADQDDYDYFRVDPKMKFRSKDDKSVILYNANIRLENIPLKAYDYIVNGKSAIEWIVERYCVSIDKKSLIKNDANDWGREHQKPRYILDLLLSVINVSTQTVDIVNSLPRLTFD